MELLEKHFDIAFAAPDGIKRMRELILTLAMQGKLVPQDPNDGTARELLKEIEAEKKRLVRNGKIKAPKPLPEIKPEKFPYKLPVGWEWVRLGSISSKITDGDHKTPPRISEGYRLLSAKNVRDGYLDFDNCDFISEQHFLKSRERCLPQTGDILIVSVGGTIGRTSLVPSDSEFALVRSVALIKPLLFDSFYLKHAMDSELLQTAIHDRKRGGAQPCLYLSEIEQFLFPLPPLAEQRRIVARVDQLMVRCDELEKLRAEREQKRSAAHSAALNRLFITQEANISTEAWQFISHHFNELYSVRANVAELRKAILSLAVMGKLVPQNPNDQPGSELLKEIEAEKRRLVKAGEIKPSKLLSEIRPEAVPYVLPEGWLWARVHDLVCVGTGSTPSTTNRDYYNGNIPWYTSSATNKKMADKPGTFITEKAIKETNCKIFPSGSLIVAMYGQGKTRGQISEIVTPGATNQAIAAMVFYESSKEIKDYLKYFFVKIYEEIRLLAEGAAQPNLNVGKIKETLVPLPPLAEQRRIVTKIDQLMALCDELEQQIDTAKGKQTALLNAVIAQV